MFHVKHRIVVTVKRKILCLAYFLGLRLFFCKFVDLFHVKHDVTTVFVLSRIMRAVSSEFLLRTLFWCSNLSFCENIDVFNGKSGCF